MKENSGRRNVFLNYGRKRRRCDKMKSGLIILLILDVIKSGKAEVRHHQQDKYPVRENYTTSPWSTTTFFTKLGRQASERSTAFSQVEDGESIWFGKEKKIIDFEEKSAGRKNETTFASLSDESHPTESFPSETVGPGKSLETQTEIDFSMWKTRMEDKYEIFDLGESDRSQVRFGKKNAEIVAVDGSSASDRSESSTRSQFETGNGNFFQGSVPDDWTDESEKYQNLNRDVLNIQFREPLLSASEESESGGRICADTVLENYVVSDGVVAEEVLTVKKEVEKMAEDIARDKRDLKMSETLEKFLEKHLEVSSISVTSARESAERFRTTETVYRRGKELVTERRDAREENRRYEHFRGDRNAWTKIFKNCLTDSWNFGHYFRVENDDLRLDVLVFFSTDHINGTVDQCNPSYREILNGGPKCDLATTKCLAVPESGFLLGGYRCVCRDGFHIAETTGKSSTSGRIIEKAYLSGNLTRFRCLSCLDSCSGACSSHELCAFQRSYLLRNSILVIQVVCVVTTSALTIVVFKHRKCKTIATGMWTIMEMILLGSIILYGTIIIRAFNPSTVVCIIEPWCREIGFVLCYGAIILKLYRILIEFRTRKAHRWVIRDKDLLKYLLGMVIVVFGYMAAWTATNLDHIQKENYSILTTGTTADGTQFKTCKAAWWDYVTQTSEILILVFGIHLSYASRNATTQFRERCFLCISITTEAFISGAFYILRYFYWETEVHPDTSFVANFVRCQLTTTVVLLLLFAPKWWYQKVQVNKGRVSRHYLTQESGRGPLEAFKPQDGVTATNSDVEGEISLADMNPEDIRIELKRLYTQLEVLKNKTIRFDNPHISKRRGGRKIAHRRFSLQKKGSRDKTLRQQTHRLSSRQTDVEVTEAEASRTPEDSVCSVEGPSIVINDGTAGETTPRKNQK